MSWFKKKISHREAFFAQIEAAEKLGDIYWPAYRVAVQNNEKTLAALDQLMALLQLDVVPPVPEEARKLSG